MSSKTINKNIKFLSGSGEMAALTRARDWSKTSLGAVETWPQSLRTTLGILLNSKFPMFLFWGPELICFYNDAFRPSLGNNGKHPGILGVPAVEAWQEIWTIIEPLIKQVLTDGEATWSEDQLIPIYRNGHIEDVYWTFSYSPVNDESEKIAGVLVTCTETTDKVNTHKKLEEREQKFRLLADSMPQFVWTADAEGNLNYVNRSVSEYSGLLPAQIEKDGWLQIVHPGEREENILRWQHSIKTGEDFLFEHRFRSVNGEYRWQLSRAVPQKDANGKIEMWFGTSTDIEEQKIFTRKLEEQVQERTKELKQLNDALKKSEERYHMMVEEVQDYAILYLNENGIVENWNKGAEKIKGYKASEIIGKNFSVFYSETDQEAGLPQRLLKIAAKEGRATHKGLRIRKDGTTFWASVVITAVHDEQNNVIGFSKVTHDLTEKKQADDALKKSEERYHLMVEEVQDYAILYLDKNGIVENWNKGAEKIKGYTANEIVGKNFSVFYSETDQEAGLPQRLLKIAAAEGKATHEGWRIRKDGTAFWASVVITAVHDENNELIGYSKVTHDLTEKKEADDQLKRYAGELEKKNKELQQMNTELQSFAYVSSHDLQEPLRKIQVFVTMINETEAEHLSEKAKGYLGRMENAAARMQTLIKDLLTYSRTNTAERKFEKTDLNKILRAVTEELKEDILQSHATIESKELCEVNVIPFQFQQLLINLIGNALKFSKPSVPPHIIIQARIVDASSLNIEKFQKNKTLCHISIADNGIGFESQYKDRIFEVFQRLHGRTEYKGTGIGLAIVKKIVENHEGIVTATGELNKGATFDIYIPA